MSFALLENKKKIADLVSESSPSLKSALVFIYHGNFCCLEPVEQNFHEYFVAVIISITSRQLQDSYLSCFECQDYHQHLPFRQESLFSPYQSKQRIQLLCYNSVFLKLISVAFRFLCLFFQCWWPRFRCTLPTYVCMKQVFEMILFSSFQFYL